MKEAFRNNQISVEQISHLSARHQYLDSAVVINQLGIALAQGDVFPAYIHAGDINRFCRTVLDLWQRFNRGQRVREIIDYHQRSDGSYKVRVRFVQSQQGIKEVKAIIKGGEVVSISPARATGSSYLRRGVYQMKKASGYNNSLSGRTTGQV
jgi:hypothetical protein